MISSKNVVESLKAYFFFFVYVNAQVETNHPYLKRGLR